MNSSPPAVAISTWIEVNGLRTGEHSFEVRGVFYHGDKQIEVGSLQETLNIVREDLPAIIAPTGLTFAVPEMGILKMRVRIDDEEEIEVGCLGIRPASEV